MKMKEQPRQVGAGRRGDARRLTFAVYSLFVVGIGQVHLPLALASGEADELPPFTRRATGDDSNFGRWELGVERWTLPREAELVEIPSQHCEVAFCAEAD